MSVVLTEACPIHQVCVPVEAGQVGYYRLQPDALTSVADLLSIGTPASDFERR